MTLFRAIHATKVLALAGLVIAASFIPSQARDWGGGRGVQTRTNHIRMYSDRAYPRYNFNRSGYRNDWNRNRVPRRDWMDGLSGVETRTRHIRLPRYRPYPGPYAERWGQRRGGWSRDRGGRDTWTSGGRHDGRPAIVDGVSVSVDGLPGVETRTRHIRLPQNRPYPGPYAERWGRGGGWARDRAGNEIWTSGGYRNNYNRGVYGNDEFPDTVPGIGTYAGGISAYIDLGNGIYFNQEGDYRYADDGEYVPPRPAKRGKIINVTPQSMNGSCAWEHGICVIRR